MQCIPKHNPTRILNKKQKANYVKCRGTQMATNHQEFLNMNKQPEFVELLKFNQLSTFVIQ